MSAIDAGQKRIDVPIVTDVECMWPLCRLARPSSKAPASYITYLRGPGPAVLDAEYGLRVVRVLEEIEHLKHN